MIFINKFIDKLQVSRSRHDKNYIISMQDAEGLHSDITKLLLVLQETSIKTDNKTTVEFKGNDW